VREKGVWDSLRCFTPADSMALPSAVLDFAQNTENGDNAVQRLSRSLIFVPAKSQCDLLVLQASINNRPK